MQTKTQHLKNAILSLILIIGFFLNSASAKEINMNSVNLDFNKVTLETILNTIEQQTSYRFFYKNQDLTQLNAVSIHIDNGSIDNVLNLLFEDSTIGYKIEDNNIILYASNQFSNPFNNQKQTKSISGTVTDEKGVPMPGVTVTVKGTTIGTITDAEGKYIMKDIDKGATLVFSFIGMDNFESSVTGKETLDAQLRQSNISLNEVVAVGYGTQKKENLTGAVSQIKADEVLADRPIPNTSEALQGTIPGLTINRGAGAPGADVGSIQIRGASSINGSSSPLVIIDGIEGDLFTINPDDIESVAVLKDAASAAIYGSRAANGVILVKTKAGNKEEKISLNYSLNYSFQKPSSIMHPVDSHTYGEMLNEARSNVDLAPMYTDTQLNWFNDPSVVVNPTTPQGAEPGNPSRYDYYANTDWVNQIVGIGHQQMHNLSMTGGTKKSAFLFSVAYIKNNGMFNMGPNEYRRYNIRANMKHELNKYITLDARLYFEHDYRHHPVKGMNSVIGSMYEMPTRFPVYDTEGNYSGHNQYRNPVQVLNDGGYVDRERDKYTINVSAIGHITKNWQVVGQYGMNTTYNTNTWQTFALDTYGPSGFTGYDAVYKLTQRKEQPARTHYENIQYYSTYENSWNHHNVKLMAGGALENSHYKGISAEAYNFISENVPSIGLADPETYKLTDDVNDWAIASFYSRVNYNYNDKYLLEINVRVDGTSRLSSNDRWGTFPSVSTGWRLGKEEFIKNLNIFDELKLRGSWGEVGNVESIGLYDYIPQLSSSLQWYPMGEDERIWTTYLNTLAAEDRTWETVQMSNLGVDMSFLNNRLTASFEYFWKKNKNALIADKYPQVIGVNVPQVNHGELTVKGWEVILGWRDQIGKVKYNVDFNLFDSKDVLSRYNNKVITGNGFQLVEGYSKQAYFGYKTKGYFKSQEDVQNSPFQNTQNKAGDVKYVDQNGDNIIDPADYVYLGTKEPRFQFGLTLGVNYKGFDFSTFFQGVGRRFTPITGPAVNAFQDQWNQPFEHQKDYWTEENQDAYFPRLTMNKSFNYQASDKWFVNAGYLKMKNLQIGYTFPKRLIEPMHVSQLRIYFNGSDLFEIDNLPANFDPEGVLNDSKNYAYPTTRQFSLGINLKI